jgi:hypothetical protein
VNTDDLIAALAADLRPVRRAPAPLPALAIWLAIGLAYVAAVVAAAGLRPGLRADFADAGWLVEQGAIGLTAIAAAYAAYSSALPDRPRWIALLPLGPFALWLALLAAGCVEAWLRSGRDGLAVSSSLACLPEIALAGAGPAILSVYLLRRAAPLRPATSLALGALAAAALGDAGLRLFHAHDASVMVLVWHFGSIALLAGLGALAGPWLLAPDRARRPA